MENRFTGFFQLAPDDPSLKTVFGDALGYTPRDIMFREFTQFWTGDLRLFRRWLEDNGTTTLSRSTIYNEYIRPQKESAFLASMGTGVKKLKDRRKRFRIPFKLMTDLAYNANTPATLNIKSFVPPDLPDPVGLPIHLFQPAQFANPELEAHQIAVQEAYSQLLENRIEAGDQFFYDSQVYEVLPDIGSFTLHDTIRVMGWPEWTAFKHAQQAALRFQHADEIEGLMRDYWATTKQLHDKLANETKKKQIWRRAGRGAVKLSIAVTTHVMGHALLPDMMHHAPWWATVASATALAQPIHGGIDIVVHGVTKAKNRLLTEIGFKDGGMRDFKISPRMQEKLQELRDAEKRLTDVNRAADSIIANASTRIASEG